MPPKKSIGKKLIIVESPSKCKKIEEFLGGEYRCISSKGHIRKIENLDAIAIGGDYSIKFSIIDEKKGHIKEMLSIIKQYPKDSIIIATDDDREGEAIGWHICDLFELDISTTMRIKFHEITKTAIINAVANPSHIDMNLVRAQHNRQVLDMLVGFKISPVLWSHIYRNPDNALSAGRCQTPALKLIYDNKREIDATPIKLMYKIRGQFLGKAFTLSKDFEREDEVLEFYKESQTHTHILSAKPPRLSYKSPPLPFNTSRLLQYASTHLGLSPKETMRICQGLYQEGYITYMRTDSQKYAATFLEEARRFLLKENGKDERILGENLGELTADENTAHEAIRCCHIEISSIEGDGSSLYHHIWKNTVQSCMSSYKYNSIDLTVSSPLGTKAVYHYVIEIPSYMGWMRLESKCGAIDIQEASTFYMAVTAMVGSQNSCHIEYEYLTTADTIKNRGSHYTEASLIQKLEDLGIGRPSTYAGIVDTLKERGYVKKENIEGKSVKIANYILRGRDTRGTLEKVEVEKKIGNEQGKLVIQFIGQVVVDFLYDHYLDLFEYGYTAKMEAQLDAIANGSGEPTICDDCHIKIMELSKGIEDTKKKEYPIDENHVLVCEKYGPVLKKREIKGIEGIEGINGIEGGYIKIKKDIDLEKIKRGEYSLAELTLSQTEIVGGSNIQRVLTPDLSIRMGKYGSYIFYKTVKMGKPDFYKLSNFHQPFLTCDKDVLVDWIQETYLNEDAIKTKPTKKYNKYKKK
jgi:DNA topoisomerase-1